jgi:hypothetical protein
VTLDSALQALPGDATYGGVHGLAHFLVDQLNTVVALVAVA